MTSPSSVVSVEDQGYLLRFFQAYDSLQREAATVLADRDALLAARDKHWELADKLKWTNSSIAFNKEFIEEQKDRIELVSNHWFYGNTYLQPQLWLRGGCTGKIDRARVKLLKAVEDQPKLEEKQQKLVEMEAVAQEYARRMEGAFERSSGADEEVKKMKEELVQRYPTQQLLRLQQDEAVTQRQILEQDKEKALLENAGSTLQRANRCVSNVENKVTSGERKLETAHQLSQQQVFLSLERATSTSSQTTECADGGTEVLERGSIDFESYTSCKRYDQEGKLIRTNHPCPNGCGYVVTWHGSYCCSACSNPQNRGKCHGPKCEGIRLACQDGAQELWQLLQKQRQEHSDKVEATRKAASEDLDCAQQELQSGFDLLHQANNLMTGGAMTSLESRVESGPPGEKNKGGMFRVQAHELESRIKEQEAALTHKRQRQEQERSRLDQQLVVIGSQVALEKDAIVESVRASILPGSYSQGKPPGTTSATASHHTSTTSSLFQDASFSGLTIQSDNLPIATATVLSSTGISQGTTVGASVVLEEKESIAIMLT